MLPYADFKVTSITMNMFPTYLFSTLSIYKHPTVMSTNHQTVQSRRASLARLPSFFAASRLYNIHKKGSAQLRHASTKRVAGNEHDAGGRQSGSDRNGGGGNNIDIGSIAAAAADARGRRTANAKLISHFELEIPPTRRTRETLLGCCSCCCDLGRRRRRLRRSAIVA